MVEHAVDHGAAAVDDVPDTGREAGFFGQLGQPELAQGNLARRLDDDAVTGGHRVGSRPQRDHPGEVERADDAEDAQGGGNDPLVDAVGDILGEVALLQGRDAAGDLDVLNAAPRFAAGLVDGLAMLHRLDAADFLEVLLEKLLQPEKDACPGYRGRPAPVVKGILGRRHGGVDLFLSGNGALPDDLHIGGVYYINIVAFRGYPFAVDVVFDFPHTFHWFI